MVYIQYMNTHNVKYSVLKYTTAWIYVFTFFLFFVTQVKYIVRRKTYNSCSINILFVLADDTNVSNALSNMYVRFLNIKAKQNNAAKADPGTTPIHLTVPHHVDIGTKNARLKNIPVGSSLSKNK